MMNIANYVYKIPQKLLFLIYCVFINTISTIYTIGFNILKIVIPMYNFLIANI